MAAKRTALVVVLFALGLRATARADDPQASNLYPKPTPMPTWVRPTPRASSKPCERHPNQLPSEYLLIDLDTLPVGTIGAPEMIERRCERHRS
jgi:hypothetical protein